MADSAEKDKEITVRVALRIRPLLAQELAQGCQTCIECVYGTPQVIIGGNKPFTFDYVFGANAPQIEVHEAAASKIILNVFKGYNATVIAYGQTGSGKTYTMGTVISASEVNGATDESGIIPRVIQDLFANVRKKGEDRFKLCVSFIELYNEEIKDLLGRTGETITIREETNGGIRLTGATEQTVNSETDLICCLLRGSRNRTVGGTAMNQQSSRSHAIFTVHVEEFNDGECLYRSKLHLVDLAGSERQKKTKSEGERFREGININLGLLALGNVISALGEEQQHIPYRESKLTRLLQDSLGGNSYTLMIACVSPADSNFEETLNTMRYADRARKIKNKPIVNIDPQIAELSRLRELVKELQAKLNEILQNGGNVGAIGTLGMPLNRVAQLEEENRKLSVELKKSTSLCAFHSLKSVMNEQLVETLKSTTDAVNGSPDERLSEIKRLLHKGEDDMPLDTIFEEAEVAQQGLENSQISESAVRQAEMGTEYHVLGVELRTKEELLHKILTEEEHMREKYEANIQELEQAIEKLEKEKRSLHEALEEAKTTATVAKGTDQRQRQIQEFESQIKELRRRMTEHQKLQRLKEQTDKECERLRNQMQDIKTHRVTLLKKMEQEAQVVRKYKMEKEKELRQLEAKDRKREAEMKRMQVEQDRQRAVVRRKTEEATAANKRLQEALRRQRKAAEMRKQLSKKDEAHIRDLIQQEVEVSTGVAELRKLLEAMIEARQRTCEQLAETRARMQAEGTPAKRRKGDFGEEDDQLKREQEELAEQLAAQTASIADMQQQVLEAEPEEGGAARWDQLTTLPECRLALRYCLEHAVNYKIGCSTANEDVDTLKDEINALKEQLAAKDNRMRHVADEHRRELDRSRTLFEEKLLTLMNVHNQPEDVQRRALEELQNARDENSRLRKELRRVSRLPPLIKEAGESPCRSSPNMHGSNSSSKINVTFTKALDEEDDDILLAELKPVKTKPGSGGRGNRVKKCMSTTSFAPLSEKKTNFSRTGMSSSNLQDISTIPKKRKVHGAAPAQLFSPNW